MLQNIREHTQGWLAWTVVLIICVTFVFWGVQSYFGDSTDGKATVATVNGVAITQSQVDAVYERLRRQKQLQLGADFSSNPALEAELKKQAVNDVVLTQVLSRAASHEGYRVAPAQVKAALARMQIFQVDGQFSKQRFEEILSNINYSDVAFLQDLQTSMAISQVRSGIVGSAFSLPDDVQQAIRLIDQKRDVAFLQVPLDYFLPEIHIADLDVRQFYKQHEQEFLTPEKVSVDYIELSLENLKAQLHFTGQQLEQFYHDNIDNFTKPASWHMARILLKVPPDADKKTLAAAEAKLQALRQRLLNKKEDFALLAKQYSQDATTAKQGGLLPWYNQRELDTPIIKAIANLQVGEVSQPVRTQEGLNLFKLVEAKKPIVQPFTQVRGEVEKALMQQQAGRQFVDKIEKLSNLAYTHPTSLETAAKELSLTIKTTDAFTRQGGKADITANPKFVAAAFDPEVVNQGNNSPVVELSSDSVVVVHLKHREAATVRPLPEVETLIRDRLRAQIAQQKADALAQSILNKLQQGVDAKQLAKQYKLAWRLNPEVGRYDTALDAAILAQAFRMPRPDRPNTFTSAAIALPTGGAAVIALTGVRDGSYETTPESKQRIFSEQLENSFGQLDYELYVRGLIKKAKVSFKNT